MPNNYYRAIAFLSTALLCMGIRCSKELIPYKYNFAEKIDLFPVQKSYKIGDTIWIQYKNSNKTLFDKLSNKNIPADTISLGFVTSFNFRYNAVINPPGGFCDYVTATGVNDGRYLGTYGTGIFREFGCGGSNSYDFTIGIVPKEKGIFCLDVGGSSSSVRPCINRVSGFPLSTIEYLFHVADCNKDIYLTIPPNSRGETPKGTTERRIDNKEIFILKVE
jgi:hypothetical protein